MLAVRVARTVEMMPATGRQDVQVLRPFQAHFELAGAVTGPDHVGVRVYKAGQDHAATGIQARFIRIGGAQFVCRTHGNDLLVPD